MQVTIAGDDGVVIVTVECVKDQPNNHEFALEQVPETVITCMKVCMRLDCH